MREGYSLIGEGAYRQYRFEDSFKSNYLIPGEVGVIGGIGVYKPLVDKCIGDYRNLEILNNRTNL